MKYSLVTKYKYMLRAIETRKVLALPNTFGNSFVSIEHGTLTLEFAYCWNGSSIPLKKLFRVLSLWMYDADRYCKIASLAHDGLCQLIREGFLHRKYKPYIDRLYRDMCIEGGLPKWRADKRYQALRKAGDIGITPEKNPRGKIFEV
ncbi:MAG TPA: hypothetical protein ENH82_06165 [bacterium]|nr:hypothetical protein [bacterium]